MIGGIFGSGNGVLRVTMLGARGVGKTSLLASVYSQFEYHLKDLSLQLKPDIQTIHILSEKLKELKSAQETLVVGGVQSTAEMRTFTFGVGLPNKKPKFEIVFRDFPGEWILNQAQDVVEFIKESDVILWAIDTAALIEKQGRWHDLVNEPHRITEFLKYSFEEIPEEHKKLILLVPIKNETYMGNEKDIKKMSLQVEEKYGRAIGLVKSSDEFGERFALAVVPVQTLGKVKFNHIEEKDGQPVFVFRRTTLENPYQPKDVEEVLRYSLSFIMRQHLENRGAFQQMWDRFTKKDRPFIQAIQDMVKQRKEAEREGFRILHGKKLLAYEKD